MDPTVDINGESWRRSDDGTWSKWNPASRAWESSDEPPTMPSSASADLIPAPPRRSSATRAISLAIGGTALVVTVYLGSGRLTSGDEEAPVVRPPAAPAEPVRERTIYSVLPRLGQCFTPASELDGDLEQRGPDPAGTDEEIARISGNLEELRGRSFPEPVDAKIVHRRRIGDVATRLAAEDVHERASVIDSKILAALGVVPRGTDLEKLGKKVIAEGIAGFYVPRTKKLYAGTGSKGLSSWDEIVLAHELDHALLDATVGLPSLDSADRMAEDEMAAHRAAIEGEATLAMMQYAVASFGMGELQEILADPAAAGSLEPGELPFALEKALAFPYNEGLLFACDLYSRGGWKAVERSLREPPVASAHVLFPDRYLNETRVVDAPDPVTPPGWKRVRAMSFGAADLLWMIQAARDVEPTDLAAGIDEVRGWIGGELHAWRRGREVALQITLVDGHFEDSKVSPAPTLCSSLSIWYTTQYPDAESLGFGGGVTLWRNDETFAAFRCSDDSWIARLALAPDRATAVRLVTRK